MNRRKFPDWRLHWHRIRWALLKKLHHLDYAVLLPLLAKLPRRLAFAAGALRGRVNAKLSKDWRSVALETRHIYRQSLAGFASLPTRPTASQAEQWTRERFVVEARDEFEASWVAARKLDQLQCSIRPDGFLQRARDPNKGLVLLTPHFDSFYLGIAFLAQATGWQVNSMSSAVSRDPRVDAAVSRHFDKKYRGLEHYLNGGAVLDMEVGLRPFYRMLEAGETLVVLADAPVLPQGAAMGVDFLGGHRMLAGGALRLAQRTQSDIGGFLCRRQSNGDYQLDFCAIGSPDNPQTLANIYQFFSDAILRQPGAWWAADLLTHMPLEEA